VIQTVTSLILIFGLVNLQILNITEIPLIFIFVILPLLIKLTLIPLHTWIYSIVFFRRFIIVFLLFSLQKIIPLLFIILIKPIIYLNFLFMLTLSCVLSPVMNWSQTSFKRIITFSRISHTCWYITALLLSEVLCSVYFILYILTSFYVFLVRVNNIYKLKIKNINQQMFLFILFLIIVGIPPFLLFYPKIMIINILITNKIILLLFILIFNSSLDFFIYIQFSYNYLLTKTIKIIWTKNIFKINKKNWRLFIFFVLSFIIWKY
jgi:NADH:ubiquinone oxidoreductase subunit 2 (subunit N)